MTNMKHSLKDIRKKMDLRDNIRTVAVVGHFRHGKSTLISSLVGDEDESEATMKASNISLCYNDYLINLVDTPGHVDFSAEVTSTLCIADGALVVVDCFEGVCLQTETVSRLAYGDGIKPVLAISKVDQCFDLQVDGEKAYTMFNQLIEDSNSLLTKYEDPNLIPFIPTMGNVAFSSGVSGWGFTLTNFAKKHGSTLGLGVDDSEKLWGEHYFDSDTKGWTTFNTGSSTCKRGFLHFCYEPIKHIISSCSRMNDQKDKLWSKLQKIGVFLTEEEKSLVGKALVDRVLQSWLPASNALLEMICYHLPSPSMAQHNHVSNFYEGDVHDYYATAIRKCDPKGPLMLYIPKVILTVDNDRFLAFGRILSGTVKSGENVRVMGPKYRPGTEEDIYVKRIQKTLIFMGKRQESVINVPCGNIVLLAGLDPVIMKNSTLTDEKEVDAHPIRAMKFSVSPVVSVSVECKDEADVPELVEALGCLARSDSLAICQIEDTNVYEISGASELHLEYCLKDLASYFRGKGELVQSPKYVPLRETVSGESSTEVMCLSPNMHNRLNMVAQPLEFGISEAIDDDRLGPNSTPNVYRRILCDEFGWDKYDAQNIWCYDPETTGPNILVDKTKGGRYMNEVRDSVVAGFKLACKQGALCEESMRGICFNLRRARLHPDAVQRGDSQMILTAKKLTCGALLSAKPRIMEPVYLVSFLAAELGNIHKFMQQKRGTIIKETQKPGTMLYDIKAHLPVLESFGFSKQLQAATSQQVYPQFVFDHWDMLSSDPLEVGSKAFTLVTDVRRRKGLNPQIPPVII